MLEGRYWVVMQLLDGVDGHRCAIWVGVVTPILALGAVFLATIVASSAEFTWPGYALSDLGRPSASTYWLFNGGLITSSVAGLVFTLPLWQYARHRIERAGAVFFALTLVALVSVGVFHLPKDFHTLASLSFFIGGPITAWIYGTGRVLTDDDGFGLLSIWFGNAHVLAWAGYIVFVAISGSGDWFAVPEMIGALLFGVWTILVARCLLEADRA